MEWSVFVLRVLSELSLVLLVQDGDDGCEEDRTEKRGGATEEREDGSSCSPVLSLISKSLLSRLVWLLLHICLTVYLQKRITGSLNSK